MPHLQPFLLLRTNALNSPAAITLRKAGYLVSKLAYDHELLEAASFAHVDAVVIDLPMVSTIELTRKLRSMPVDLPVLAMTGAPELMRRQLPGLEIFDVRDPNADLISSTDLMLSRHELSDLMMAQAM